MRLRKTQRGFALLICLVVAAICSVIAIGLFKVIETESVEVNALDKQTIADRLARSGSERAVALLLQDGAIRGALPAVELPAQSGNVITTNISENNGSITISSTASVQQFVRTHQYTFQVAELDQRRAAMSP